MKMSKELASECIKVLDECCGIMLELDQFVELVNDNPWVEENIIEYNSPRDTMEREDLMEILAKKVTGKSWPCYSDGHEYSHKFHEELRRNAKLLGYKMSI